MRVAVVYESLYGNTRRLAEAIADGLGDAAEVSLVNVREPSPALLADLDLLVAGGPTHVHGMSSRRTRKGAADDAGKRHHTAPDVEGTPLRDWLDGLPQVNGLRAAAFDTRLDKPKFLVGTAAKGVARRLHEQGYEVVGEESFLVGGTEGPLLPDEIARARAWGQTLVAVPAAHTR